MREESKAIIVGRRGDDERGKWRQSWAFPLIIPNQLGQAGDDSASFFFFCSRRDTGVVVVVLQGAGSVEKNLPNLGGGDACNPRQVPEATQAGPTRTERPNSWTRVQGSKRPTLFVVMA